MVQALRQLPILLDQLLLSALLRRDTLRAIRDQAWRRPSRQSARQEVVTGIPIRNLFQVASLSQTFYIL